MPPKKDDGGGMKDQILGLHGTEDDNKDYIPGDTDLGIKPEDAKYDDPQDPNQIIDPNDPLDRRFLVQLPEDVRVERIARTVDVKSIWRQGIRELETIFADHIQKMSEQFEDYAMEYETVRGQITTNHTFLQRYYLDMQARLNEKYEKIMKERMAWEKEKAEIKALTKMDSEVIHLNVGGTVQMSTERDVLRLVPESTLAKMFNGMHELKKIDDKVFLDRDGRSFLHLVNYLRNDRTVFPEYMDKNDEIMFFKELDFWKIPPILKKKGQSLDMSMASGTSPARLQPPVKSPVSNQTFDVANTEDSHGVALKAAKDKWNELGPLKLEDIVSNSKEAIDQTLTFGQSKYNKYIIGQLGPNGKVTGVGKEINHIIYEGQFRDDIYNGFGRFIYSNGNYYIGNWLDGKRSGFGKLVDKSGRVYEGQWQYSKFMGE